MSLPPVARRGLAVVASAALLSSGAAGIFTGTAWAAAGGKVTSVSPAVTNNSGDTAVTVTGTGLTPGGSDTITFHLEGTASSYGANTPSLKFTQSTAEKSASSDTSYSGTVATNNAPPGVYDVYATPPGGTAGTLCSGCFTVASSGPPNVSNVLTGEDTRFPPSDPTGDPRGAGTQDIYGQRLAQGSRVDLLDPATGQPDPYVDFLVNDPNGAAYFNGYESSSIIRGNYRIKDLDKFTPGRHLVRVTNTAFPTPESGATGELWLPKFALAGVSPTVFGAGVSGKVLTIKGQGFRQGSRIGVQNLASPADQTHTYPDNSVGAATVSADGTTIGAPVSFASDAKTGTLRSVTVNGPDGGTWTVGNAISVTAPPKISSLGQSDFGQGASRQMTITGTGFAVGATAADRPSFTAAGTGVTITTVSSTNLQAVVQVDVDPSAATGSRVITVTNPDGGSSTFSGTNSNPGLSVVAGPKITSVSPTSAAAGTSKTITISGSTFDNATRNQDPTAKPTIQFFFPPAPGASRQADPSMAVSNVTSTPANSIANTPDQVTFTLAIAGNSPSGLRDIVLTNPSDGGTFVCSGCFGIDSLTASPASGANTGTKTVQFTAGVAIPSGSTVRLNKAGNVGVQPDIPGSSTIVNNTTISAVFDLTSAATGPYNAIVTTPSGGTFSCSSCFTVTGPAPTVSSISPASGGQGALNRAATITGTNFSRGMQVTIADVTVHDVTFVSPTTLTLRIDIPTNAPTGTKDVTVTNNDASQKVTKTGAYTVTAAPAISSVSPTALGQGAKAAKITISGSGFQKGSTPDTTSTASFGQGITVTGVTVTKGNGLPAPLGTSDTLVATVDVDPNAALTTRDVTVSNPDGGVGIVTQGLTVNPGPKVTSITPNFLAPDGSGDVTIAGSGFSTTSGKNAVPTIAGVTLSNVQVTATSITATATVDSGTAKGVKDVVVTNPTDSGQGACTGCFYVATPPSAPVQVHSLSVTGTSVTVGWSVPSDDGGAPVTSYVVSATGPDSKPAGTPATTNGSATSGTVNGLTSGVKYTISVIARNVAGDSVAGTTLTQTTGTASTKPTLTINKSAMNVGQSATLIIRGTPGDSVQFIQRSQPSTTSTTKTFTFDSLGNVVINSFPRTNTAYLAHTAAGDSSIVTLSVRPAVSLRGSSANRLATFTGVIVPGHGGVKVRIYSVKNGVLGPLVASAVSDSQGHYTATHQFAGGGTVQFVAQTVSDTIALAGQSNRLNLTIR